VKYLGLVHEESAYTDDIAAFAFLLANVVDIEKILPVQ
jgi:hypothetical protein